MATSNPTLFALRAIIFWPIALILLWLLLTPTTQAKIANSGVVISLLLLLYGIGMLIYKILA
jgi:hypothetical protein